MPKPELPTKLLPERSSSSQPVYGAAKPFSGSVRPPVGAWSHLPASPPLTEHTEQPDPLSHLEERLGLLSSEEGAREAGARQGRFATRAQPQGDHRRSRGTYHAHFKEQTASPQKDTAQAEPLRARL